MTNASMTPGSRPRRGVIGVLALLGAGALTAGLVLAAGEASDPPRVAGAVELATFASCEDLAAWGEEAMTGPEEQFGEVGADIATSGAADADGAPVPAAAARESSGEQAFSSSDDSLSAENESGAGSGEGSVEAPPLPTTVPATTGPASTTTTPVPEEDEPSDDEEPEADEPEETEPEEAEEPAEDETNVAVEGVDEIDLVDRLTEDVVLVASATRLAVVDLVEAEVVEAATVPWDAQVTYDAETGIAWVVGHPDTGGVSVERWAVDPADGLEQEGAWSTPGFLVDARRVGDELHLVASDGFTAMPAVSGVAEDGAVVVEPGAPEIDTVPFTGGPVPCDEVLHPIGPSDPTATLLVTLPATGAVEPVRATEVVGSGSLVHVTTESIYLATPQWEDDTTTTGIHRFDLATLEPTGSGSVEGSMLDEFSMSEHEGVLRVAVTHDGGFVAMPAEAPMVDDFSQPRGTVVPTTSPVPVDPLNEIVVLDTDGALDVVGRTERFGHEGETLHGVRFAGTTAYAVTFLQTDPFYVVDLSDPADPQVVGEVELPGFSSYLHPLGDGLVVGFGPGGDGRSAAKLFDVSDPSSPEVVGDLTLGDDSVVATDHHAYLDLGDGRFAVPAMTYGTTTTSAVVVLDTAGGELVEVARHEVTSVETATRVLTVDDGWALLAGPEIITLDAGGAEVARIAL